MLKGRKPKNEVNPWNLYFLMKPNTKLKLALQMWHLHHFRFLILFYFNLFSLFNLSAKYMCRDFKIQVLPAAFYLNENVNFKHSAASGKMSTQGCCCWGAQHLWLLQCWSKSPRMIKYYLILPMLLNYWHVNSKLWFTPLTLFIYMYVYIYIYIFVSLSSDAVLL